MGAYNLPHITPLTAYIMCAILPDDINSAEIISVLCALRHAVRSLASWYTRLLAQPAPARPLAPPAPELMSAPAPWPLWFESIQ